MFIIKTKITISLLYFGNYLYKKKIKFYIIIKFFYKFIVEYFFTIELPLNIKIGKGLKIDHGQGLVVNAATIIGNNVTLKHNTTIGCKTDNKNKCIKHSIIEDNVIVHPHVCIVGARIGKNSIIGAGSIVIKDVPPNSIVAGNPAKVIKIRDDIE